MKTPPVGMDGLDIVKFKSKIDNHGTHTCGGNLFWADVFFTATPGVPINRRGVQRITFVFDQHTHTHPNQPHTYIHVSRKKVRTHNMIHVCILV